MKNSIPRTHRLPSIWLTVLLATLPCSFSTAAASPEVHPVMDEGFSQSLNGEWKFRYIAALEPGSDAGFFEPDFVPAGWDRIPVPSNWELEGFAEPQYQFDLEDGLGLYRRSFAVPAEWRDGRRVFLRFEGVAYGFDAWVNGRKVGRSSASAYNPHTFEVTEALGSDANAENLLSVQVTTKPLGFGFDINDDWSLSGIYRDVTLFSVPETHVQGVSTETRLTDEGAAELHIGVTVNDAGGALRGRLVGPDGATVAEFDLRPGDVGNHEAVVRVEDPRLWTAETPALYRLELVLSSEGGVLQRLEERIGLREVSIVDGVFLLNGRPIKLRGVNRHDLDPETGRAVTEEQMRRDLEMMRRANVNFVRSSHYPPNRRFIELCDELGFYVMDEVAIGMGEEHLEDPAYRDTIMARVRATIARDRNHPSVLLWSIGNENPVTAVEMDAARLAKDLDSSRPVCIPKIGSYFERNYQRIPEFVEVYSPHYPKNATVRKYAESLDRPTIFTEYAHAMGLATGRVQDQWDIIESTPHLTGGAIWHFMDQGILRRSEEPVDRSKPTEAAWRDPHHYYDTHGGDGMDGVVYSDRRPHSDYWQLRKVYAPVQILERSAEVEPGLQKIRITVENRHDFRSLAGMQLDWSLRRNGELIGQGEQSLRAEARGNEAVVVAVEIPEDAERDMLMLELACIDESGRQVNERVLRLDLRQGGAGDWWNARPAAAAEVSEEGTVVKVVHPDWTLTVDRETTAARLVDAAGELLLAGIRPHVSRKLTLAEDWFAEESGTWRVKMLDEVESPHVEVRRENESIVIRVSGRYPRPDKRSQSLSGAYEALVDPSGAIRFSYDYVPVDATGVWAEAGLSLVVPAEATEFRWIGDGPHAGYPGKDRLNEFGLFHLHRDDIRFQGNRRKTELALLSNAAGAGVALASTPADVAVEIGGDVTLLKHNALISGLGNKGAGREPAVEVEVARVERVSGSFTLIPLSEEWPESLERWFGRPSGATDVYQPFYHSYDQ